MLVFDRPKLVKQYSLLETVKFIETNWKYVESKKNKRKQ